MKDYRNHSLLQHTTFGIEATADRFVEYETVEELLSLLPALRETAHLQIGAGSNLLFVGPFHGIVLHSGLKGISVQEEGDAVLLKAASGEVWDDVVAYAVEHGWSGMENLSAIPGEVGASAVQNIGAYGAEAKDLIVEMEAVEWATGQLHVIRHDECRYAYRQSIFKNEWKGRFIIVSVTYRLQKQFVPQLDYGNIRAELERRLGGDYERKLTLPLLRQVVMDIRRAKLPDPKVLGNAGSFFMNPVISKAQYELLRAAGHNPPFYGVDDDHVKIPAGWLIEQCGWKGRRVGRVGVYEKQALILVNHGGATGEEVVALSDAICRDVKDKFGITIKPEVNFI
ncbi:MAG: UDP-N-acetylmuramate dehydrogenase [Bacteroidaceae bacterium]|nr:UDP-N-acetylmuramate dehydrogenase [Bacteroidaceae bacterium]